MMDVEQYKMQNVKDGPIESRQRYLDVICFLAHFPSGQFGEFHPRTYTFQHPSMPNHGCSTQILDFEKIHNTYSFYSGCKKCGRFQ